MPKKGYRGARHGGYALVKPLPIRRYLTNVRAALIRDLAGGVEERLSAQEVILIDAIINMLGVTRCIEEYIRDHSVMKGEEIAPALGHHYISYRRTIESHLKALGLDIREFKEGKDLETVVAEIVKKRGRKKKSD